MPHLTGWVYGTCVEDSDTQHTPISPRCAPRTPPGEGGACHLDGRTTNVGSGEGCHHPYPQLCAPINWAQPDVHLAALAPDCRPARPRGRSRKQRAHGWLPEGLG